MLWKDPCAARDDYVHVIADRSPDNVRSVLGRPGRDRGEAHTGDDVLGLKLLEMQRHLLLMYTSCGWFFDELSGIETVQVIQYAARAVQLAEELFGVTIEEEFLRRLERARSNLPEHKDGRVVYEKFVRPARVDLPKVAAHYAVSSLFESYDDDDRLYCCSVHRLDQRADEVGKARLRAGTVRVVSEVTGDATLLSYGAVHFGDHNLHGGVRPYPGEAECEQVAAELKEAFH